MVGHPVAQLPGSVEVGVDPAAQLGGCHSGRVRKQREDLVIPHAYVMPSGEHALPECELQLGDDLARRLFTLPGLGEVPLRIVCGAAWCRQAVDESGVPWPSRAVAAVIASETAFRVEISAKCAGSIRAADTRAFHPYRAMALALSPPAAVM